MNNVPQTVLKIIAQAGGGRVTTERLDHSKFLFEGRLLVPEEGWDWTEALSLVDTANLNRVFEANVGNGPTVSVFEKADTTQPAYVVLRSMDHFFWLEW